MSISDTICTCGAMPECDSFGNALPCMRCYFGPPPDATLRCAKSGNPCGTDTHRVGHACECTPCRQWTKAFRDGLEVAARHIADKAKMYPLDVFPEPTGAPGEPIDRNSAAMGRHCAKVWSASLLRLAWDESAR